MNPRSKYNYRAKYRARSVPYAIPARQRLQLQRRFGEIPIKHKLKMITEESQAKYRYICRLRRFFEVQSKNPCRLEQVGSRPIGIMRCLL